MLTHSLRLTNPNPLVYSAKGWSSGETAEPSWTPPGPAQQVAPSFST